ncbi:MAG: glycosyltransferase, partial [Actinomycetes bacterium]
GIARDRIRLVPWCLSQPLVAHATPPAQPASTPAPDSAVDSAELAGVSAKSFNTQSKYFLYPAVTYPHKNHLMLLEAFARVVKDDPEVSLVLTGASGPLEGEVLTRIQQLGLSDSVQRRGRVSQEQLDALFDRAVAVVVPSLYEGFGLPALEAMWRGCLVIGSDRGSLPEVLRAEDLVHAEDLTAWVTAMQSVLVLTTSQRDERVKAGQLRAAAFTPERTADALLNAYRSAGGILHEG